MWMTFNKEGRTEWLEITGTSKELLEPDRASPKDFTLFRLEKLLSFLFTYFF